MFEMNNDPKWLLQMAAQEDSGCISVGSSKRFYDIDEVWDAEWDELLEGVDPDDDEDG